MPGYAGHKPSPQYTVEPGRVGDVVPAVSVFFDYLAEGSLVERHAGMLGAPGAKSTVAAAREVLGVYLRGACGYLVVAVKVRVPP